MTKTLLFICALLGVLNAAVVGAAGHNNDSRVGWAAGHHIRENRATVGPSLRVGWAVGHHVDENGVTVGPSILHTRNGGRTWNEQANPYEWPGYSVTDVSAVDRRTAWAALAGSSLDQGAILHTRDGGRSWIAQELPVGLQDVIKQVKGLSRLEAWAATLSGTMLHTTDGGETWRIVEHPSVQGPLNVNRMDVIGCVAPHKAKQRVNNQLMDSANIWVSDHLGGDAGGIIHSLNNGLFWRRESVPVEDPHRELHMLDAYSPSVAWASLWSDGRLFRTDDGGEHWKKVAEVGINDTDDMCSPSATTLWGVQFQSGGGNIFRVRLYDDGEPDVDSFSPPAFRGYAYEGVTCVDDQTALVVGFRTYLLSESLPDGIILSTTDGGQTWTRHSAPVDDVALWKTSFVGARR